MGTPRITKVLAFVALLVGPVLVPALAEDKTITHTERSVNVYVPAVGQTTGGNFVGVLSVLTLRALSPGRGDVFVRIDPLADIDMQASARLAVEAAGELTGRDATGWDFIFTITTRGPIIGGPSAGALMSMAAAAILMNWSVTPNVSMTGMINPDLSVGLVGGIYYKAEALASVGVKTFLIPAGERYQLVEGQAVDIVTEGRSRWDMDVHEVEDLYDVVPHFTGLAAERPTTSTDPTTNEVYRTIMSDASQSQRANAHAQHDSTQATLEQLRARVPASTVTTLEQALAESSDQLQRADAAAQEGRHYRAASFAFLSLVETRFASAVLEYYGLDPRPEPGPFVDGYLDRVAGELDGAASLQDQRYPATPSELGAEAAVELRLEEAERLLREAQQHDAADNYLSALRAAGYARERVGSAQWWSGVRNQVAALSTNESVTFDGLVALGRRYQENAQLMIAYAGRVLGEAGVQTERLGRASLAFDQGTTALRADHPAAGVFHMLESISLVNAAMASLNSPEALDQRLETLRQRTAYEIELARDQSIEPVFAASLFEVSGGAESVDAYELLSYARMAARATLVAGGYKPLPPNWIVISEPSGFTDHQRFLQGSSWAWMTLVGVPAVFGLGLAAIVAASPLGRAKK